MLVDGRALPAVNVSQELIAVCTAVGYLRLYLKYSVIDPMGGFCDGPFNCECLPDYEGVNCENGMCYN